MNHFDDQDPMIPANAPGGEETDGGMTALLWAAVIPLGFFTWFFVFLIGGMAHDLLLSFCPSDLLNSGTCMATWFVPGQLLLQSILCGIGGASLIAVAVATAPGRHRQVAWLAYGAAVLMGLFPAFYKRMDMVWGYVVPVVFAALFGWLALQRILRRHPNP